MNKDQKISLFFLAGAILHLVVYLATEASPLHTRTGWGIILFLCGSALFYYASKLSRRYPIGHRFADGRKVIGYSSRGKMITTRTINPAERL